eukprot:scaffold81489_cov42-Prasinocladus_malaysianus.AAC.1
MLTISSPLDNARLSDELFFELASGILCRAISSADSALLSAGRSRYAWRSPASRTYKGQASVGACPYLRASLPPPEEFEQAGGPVGLS